MIMRLSSTRETQYTPFALPLFGYHGGLSPFWVTLNDVITDSVF